MTKVTQRGRHSGTGTGSGRSRASRRRLFIFRFSGSMGPAVRSRCQLDDWLSTVNERLFQRFYCENGDSFTAAAASLLPPKLAAFVRVYVRRLLPSTPVCRRGLVIITCNFECLFGSRLCRLKVIFLSWMCHKTIMIENGADLSMILNYRTGRWTFNALDDLQCFEFGVITWLRVFIRLSVFEAIF